MSVNKLGSNLTPYTKSSSIFEGHPNANLASVGKVGVVHSGNLQIGVYSTLYEAYGDGVKVGQLYGLGKLHPTGLINGAGGEPGPEEEMEHGIEMIEEIEKIPEGLEEKVVEGEVSITATPVVIAEDCELVVYEIRVFTGYELKLCEQKSLITSIASQEADAIFNQKEFASRTEALNQDRKVKAAEEEAINTTIEESTNQLQQLQENYDKMTEDCAKQSGESGAGQSEACQALAKFIAEGNVDDIAILTSRIADLTVEINGVRAEIQAIDELLLTLENEIAVLKKQISLLSEEGMVQGKLLTVAEDTYASLGSSVAPNIGQMNSLAVGKTTIAGCGEEQECCPLPLGPEGEQALFNLEILAKLMSEGGGVEEPKSEA